MSEPMKQIQMHSLLQNRKLWAVIPAAGSGRRFSETALKQYQKIQNKTVLEHTIQRLTHLPLSAYVLAISEQDDVAKTLDLNDATKAKFCLGGNERVDSVLNALHYLSDFASDEDWVFVHDAARPCVSVECLENLVTQAIETDQSAILAIPVRDTLKRVQTDFEIQTTVDRSQLWQAQTPQISKLGLLRQAIEQALEHGVSITDEASALEYIGAPVQVVMGRSDNIKITYPEDLDLARLILQSQNQ